MKIFIDSPTAVLTGLVLILILCVGQFKHMPITLLPKVERNFIRLVIDYPPHASDEILIHIQPLIRQLESVSGLENVNFEIHSESTMILLEFKLGSDREGILQEINARLDMTQAILPSFMDRPIIPGEAAEKLFEMKLVIQGRESTLEISRFVQKSLIPRLKQIHGVSYIDISGTTTEVIELIIDPIKMASWGVKVEDLNMALHQRQVGIGSLSLSTGLYTYLLVPEIDPFLIGEIPLSGNIRVKDIAIINDNAEVSKGLHYFNGDRAVILRIFTSNNARLSSLTRKLHRLTKDLQQNDDISMTIIQDQTQILFSSIENLGYSLLTGGLSIFLLFILFMGDYRLPLIIGFIIPLSVIFSIGLFSVLDITINIISLSGITLGLGLLVDNAIILLENIVRYHSRGLCSREACLKGVSDILGPLLGSNLTTIGIFIPLLIGGGIVGVIFKEEAIVISLIIVCSILLSFLLLPLIYHLTFSSNCPHSEGILYRKLSHGFHLMSEVAFERHLGIIVAFFIITIFGISSGFNIPVAYLPKYENQERKLLFSFGTNLIFSSFHFQGHTSELIVGKSGNMLNPDTAPYTLIITGPRVNEIADSLKNVYQDDVIILSTPTTFSSLLGSNEPEVIIKAYSNNPPLSPQQPIAEQNILKEPIYNHHVLRLLRLHSKDIDRQLTGMMNKNYKETSVSFISGDNFPITRGNGRPVHFNEVAFMMKTGTDVGIEGDNKGRYTSFAFALEEFKDKGTGLLKMLDKQEIPYTISGSYYRGKKIQSDLLIMGLTAIFLLFMILAIQFESFVWPLVVMSVIPVGIAGSLGALHLTGQTLNVMSGIGIVAMLGIVVNDAILKVSAIRKCDSSWPVLRKLREAHDLRLKPILMTTGTTVLSCLPMLFFTGIGNELQQTLVIAIMGGLVSATFAAIFLIPAIVLQRK